MPPALRPRTRASHVDAPRVTTLLPGPPLRLPWVMDRATEGWWRLTPRARGAVIALVTVATVTVVLLRVALSPYGPPVDVLVATRDLASGSALGHDDVTVRRWPRDLVPPEPLQDPADLVGSRLTARVTAGTVLAAAHLRDDDPLARLDVDRAADVAAAALRGTLSGAVLAP